MKALAYALYKRFLLRPEFKELIARIRGGFQLTEFIINKYKLTRTQVIKLPELLNITADLGFIRHRKHYIITAVGKAEIRSVLNVRLAVLIKFYFFIRNITISVMR